MDIIGPEFIDIIISQNLLYIDLYEINVSIFVKTRSINSVRRVVYAKSGIIIPFYSTILIPIYYIIILGNRDFLFELFLLIYLFLYVYLVDSDVY